LVGSSTMTYVHERQAVLTPASNRVAISDLVDGALCLDPSTGPNG
jgi:hypothetical protein